LGPAIESRPVITPPYEPLAGAVAGLGHNFLILDPDGPARRLPPFVRQGERYIPSLGVAAALLAEGIAPADVVLEGGEIRIGERRLPLVPVDLADDSEPYGRRVQQTMLINYLAPPHVNGVRPYASYAANDLLRSEGQLQSGEMPDVDPGLFKGKIVFVGTTAAGLHDVFQTPFGESVMPGIQLHASITDSVLSAAFFASRPTGHAWRRWPEGPWQSAS
jgi:adenylate cyclase